HRGAVAVIIDADCIEIELSPPDGKVTAPIVWVPFQHDTGTWLHLRNSIGATGKRLVEACLVEGFRCQGVLWQNWHEPHDQGHFAVAISGESELDAALTNLLSGGDLRIRSPVVPAFVLQERPREQDVVRRDRRSIGKAGFGADLECD